MIPWNSAYRRLAENVDDFRIIFGKTYRQDEFRSYAYAIKFDSILPALQASSDILPNTPDAVLTGFEWGAPSTALVPGPPQTRLVDFPAGAVILGITASATLLQAIPVAIINDGEFGITPVLANFLYGPSNRQSLNDLFMLDFTYADTDPITTGNPIPETVPNPNAAIVSRPPISAAALLGDGRRTDMPSCELCVTPGLGIITTVRSLLLPSFLPLSGNLIPNMSVHVVFHAMIPGTVSLKKAA